MRSEAEQAPCTPKLGRGTHIQDNPPKQASEYARMGVGTGVGTGCGTPFTPSTRLCCRRRRLLNFFHERPRIALARKEDRTIQEALRCEIGLRDKLPQLAPRLAMNPLSQCIATAFGRSNHQHRERFHGCGRKVATVHFSQSHLRVARRLARRNLANPGAPGLRSCSI